jgi:RND family efflux transporter MFP subunit
MKPSCLLLPAVLALFAGCSREQATPATAGSLPPVRVQVATVRLESIPALTEITGTVRPVQRAVIAAKVMGAIEELPITLGQRIRAGELLLKISAGEISARLAQAQAQLDQARRDFERERDLLARSASTTDIVKNLETRVALTESMVREAETMLGYATVRAPFGGVVARKLVNAGDFAAPGQPLLEIEGPDTFQIETGIPDSLAAALTTGTALSVEVPAANATFTTALTELSSAADPFAHTVPAKIAVPAGVAVRSGQFARIQVPGPAVRALLAPATAVSVLGQMERVFVVGDGGKAVLRLVKTGATRDDRVEILSGLGDGDRIIVAPPANLREGQPLEVLP